MMEKDRSEIALICFFLGVAGVFVVRTFGFRSESATLFPRLTAAVVAIGGILLLLEDRLPESLRRIVAEPVDLIDREEFSSDRSAADEGGTAEDGMDASEPDDESAGADEQSDAHPDDTGRISPRAFLFLAVVGYAVVGYVASILIATPFFVAAYGRWNGQPPAYVAVLVAVGVALCLTFISLANAPLDRGLLFPGGIL